MKQLIVGATFFVSIAHCGNSVASIVAPPEFSIDLSLTAIDSIPPATPIIEIIDVHRGIGPRDNGDGSWSSISTDAIGVVTFAIRTSETDKDPVSEIGVKLVDLGGEEAIENLRVPDYFVRPTKNRLNSEFTTYVFWIDGATDEQEPIAHMLAIHAVDRAGNVSAHADTVKINDPGRWTVE